MMVKQSGAVLLPTLIICGMLLGLALALTKIVSSELQFSADLLLGEQAYFAAESGVEEALLSLRDKPINLVDIQSDLLNPAEIIVSVTNVTNSFDFMVGPSQTFRWRLGRDVDSTLGFDQNAVREIKIKGDDIDDNLQWKIQCGVNGETLMIQSRADGTLIDKQSTGVFDKAGVVEDNFSLGNYFQKIEDKSVCYISLTNFGEEEIAGTISSDEGMAPAQTNVRALGRSGGREKIIEFEYRQKNLSPFFDFGLLHSK